MARLAAVISDPTISFYLRLHFQTIRSSTQQYGSQIGLLGNLHRPDDWKSPCHQSLQCLGTSCSSNTQWYWVCWWNNLLSFCRTCLMSMALARVILTSRCQIINTHEEKKNFAWSIQVWLQVICGGHKEKTKVGKNYKNPVYDPAKSTFSFPVRLKVLFLLIGNFFQTLNIQLALLCFSAVPSFVTLPPCSSFQSRSTPTAPGGITGGRNRLGVRGLGQRHSVQRRSYRKGGKRNKFELS